MLDAITIVHFRDSSSFSVQAVKTFPNTEAGEKEAKKCFKQWCRNISEGLVDHDHPAGLNDDIEESWDDGQYEIGYILIAVLRTTR